MCACPAGVLFAHVRDGLLAWLGSTVSSLEAVTSFEGVHWCLPLVAACISAVWIWSASMKWLLLCGCAAVDSS